jgi:exonuclease SbcD
MMSQRAQTLTICHTSDWHLGHELNGHAREAEHDLFLQWLLDRLEAEAVDVLLVTGDVYDVANPPVSAMRRLFRFLNLATTRLSGLQVVVIGGNHDSAARIDLPAALLGEGRVHFIGALPRKNGSPDFESLLLPLFGPSGDIGAWLAAVPFCRPGDLGSHDLPSLYDAVAEAGKAQAGDLPMILTGHLHVAGGEVSELSERRIVIGGEEAQAATLFDARAAYVALGHLHRPQAVAAETTVRYAGSPFPLSSAERDYRHSVVIVKVQGSEVPCQVELLPIPRPVDFLAVGPAPLDTALAAIEALQLDAELSAASWPFIEIAIEIDGPEPDLQSRILAAIEPLPVRLVRIATIRPQDAGSSCDPLVGAELADLDPDTVFAALFNREYGGDGPPDDLARAFATLLIETQAAEEPA